MRVLTLAGLIPALLAFFPFPAAAQQCADSPAPGFGRTVLPVAQPFPAGGLPGLARTLSTGEVVTFDGQLVERWAADGSGAALLADLGTVVFTGCFAIDPTETFAVLGESSTHAVYRVDLAGGGLTPLVTLTNNFDAVFEDANHVLICANLGGGFSDNDILRVDVNTGDTSTVAQLLGPSGPLSIDPFGNLVYATQGASSDVLLWMASQVEATKTGPPLTAADAFVIATGFPGIFDLVHDPSSGALYASEVDYSTFPAPNRIVRVLADPASSPTIVQGVDGNAPGTLEFVEPTGDAIFFGYQPATGGTLRYATTDFFSCAVRAEVRPARPQVALSGPGTSGAGSIVYDLTGGMPNGSFHVMAGPSSGWNADETLYSFAGLPPLFSGLDPATTTFFGTLHALDGSGAGSASFENPTGALVGAVATQAFVFDLATMQFATSSVAFL